MRTFCVPSVQLYPHTDVGIPRFGMNPNISCLDGWQDLARHRIVNVIVGTKELGWKENKIIERLNKNDIDVRKEIT